MKAMLLAAGKGHRMRPLTVGQAKPTLPLLGRPLLLSTLDRLAEASVTEVLVNLHHLPESVRLLVERGLPSGMSVTFSEEQEILGTAGGLKAVEGLLSDEDPFLLVNGDCYYGFSFAPIVQAHRESRALATMALRPLPPHSGFGKVEVDAAGFVVRIAGNPGTPVRRPAAERMFLGLHVLSGSIWRYMSRSGNYDINADVYPLALADGAQIRGLDVHGTWHDIGTPRRYLAANLDLLHAVSGPGPAPAWPGVSADPPVFAGPGVEIGPGSILKDGAVLGAGVKVGHSVQMARVVVMDGCHIGARSTLCDCILYQDVEVPPDTDLLECVVFPVAGHERDLRRRELQGKNVIARFDSYGSERLAR